MHHPDTAGRRVSVERHHIPSQDGASRILVDVFGREQGLGGQMIAIVVFNTIDEAKEFNEGKGRPTWLGPNVTDKASIRALVYDGHDSAAVGAVLDSSNI